MIVFRLYMGEPPYNMYNLENKDIILYCIIFFAIEISTLAIGNKYMTNHKYNSRFSMSIQSQVLGVSQDRTEADLSNCLLYPWSQV